MAATSARAGIEAAITKCSNMKITRLSLGKFAVFGREPDRVQACVKSCRFLHREGPVRLAHMIREMRTLPPFMLEQPLLNKVYGWYQASFRDLYTYPHLRATPSENELFQYSAGMTRVIETILSRHEPVVLTIAQAMQQLEQERKLAMSHNSVREFLDRFYMSRIGIRFLFNQHQALFAPPDSARRNKRWIGSIDPSCRVADVAVDAANAAKFICQESYGRAPEMKIVTPKTVGSEEITFTYIPSHLYLILFELLKNSYRAVATHHEGAMPAVRVVIVKGKEDLTIKVSDEGGGIPHRNLQDIFSYFYTTATPQSFDPNEDPATRAVPMAGFGYGLPLSRLYARYLGGDMNVISVDGYGTDAYLYLKTAAENAVEVLPTYNQDEIKYTDVFQEEESHQHWMAAQGGHGK
eukprot:m.73244 g.73244  ORF g.73244 m.73244 type:complete len:409 (-) comp14446_c0_seq1:385-1611(-)